MAYLNACDGAIVMVSIMSVPLDVYILDPEGIDHLKQLREMWEWLV